MSTLLQSGRRSSKSSTGKSRQQLSHPMGLNVILASDRDIAFCSRLAQRYLTVSAQTATLVIVFGENDTWRKVPILSSADALTTVESTTRLLFNTSYFVTLSHRLYMMDGRIYIEGQNPSFLDFDVITGSIESLEQHQIITIRHAVILGSFEIPSDLLALIDGCADTVWVEQSKHPSLLSKALSDKYRVATREEIIQTSYHPVQRQPFSMPVKMDIKATRQGEFDSYPKLIDWLKSQNGIDFGHYRQTWLAQQIKPRCSEHSLDSVSEYLSFCESHLEEADYFLSQLSEPLNDEAIQSAESLYTEIKSLAERLFTAQLSNQSSLLRAWVPGCGSGEEAHLFAIAWKEVCKQYKVERLLQVFATDIDQNQCKEGSRGLTTEQLALYSRFSPIANWVSSWQSGLALVPEIKYSIVFSKHDLTSSPPLVNLDVIICRNTLSLFKDSICKSIMAGFHSGLKDSGYLMVGQHESFDPSYYGFRPTDTAGTYQKNSKADPQKRIEYAKMVVPEFKANHYAPPLDSLLRHHRRRNRYLDYSEVMDKLIDRYIPCGLLIDSEQEIVHIIGDMTEFTVCFDKGNYSRSIQKRLVPLLSNTLMPLIEKAFDSQSSVIVGNVELYGDSESSEGLELSSIDVHVAHLSSSQGKEDHCAVLFQWSNFSLVSEESSHDRMNGKLSKVPAELTVIDALTQSDEVPDISNASASTFEKLFGDVLDDEGQQSLEQLVEFNASAPRRMSDSDHGDSLSAKYQQLKILYENLSSSYETLIEESQTNPTQTALYENILTNLTVGALVVNKKMCLCYFNPAMTKWVSLENEDVSRKTWLNKLQEANIGFYQLIKKLLDQSIKHNKIQSDKMPLHVAYENCEIYITKFYDNRLLIEIR